ncbi:MAG: LPS export ABC transporter permease LptG [Kangiellaceae bacterium]|nr:LPS export ABC transporter permease LptG [Kangiellaceae bacterium]
MNILRFYIGKTILASSIMTLVVLAVIRVLFSLIDESSDFGKGSYQFIDGISYALLLAPKYIYEFFPMAILIGSIAGLGILASRSELTVMRAAGKTTGQIVGAALSYGMILIAVAILLGEYVAPKTTQMAEDIRNRAIYGDRLLKSTQGLWVKDGQNMVHISEVIGASKLKDVSIYQFNEQQQLKQLTQAASAELTDSGWTLINGQQSVISSQQIVQSLFDAKQWPTSINLDHLSVLKLEPETLNIRSLYEYRNYLHNNGLDTQAYDLAFWRKIIQPISIAVMIVLAASFIFGPMRSVSMGARVLVGVLTGMMYFFAIRTFGPVSLVFGLPAFFGALLPPLLFAFAAWYMLKKAG